MSKITKQDTNGVKPLLGIGVLGYDNYPAGGDAGRVWVGTGTENIALAKKTEVLAVDSKADNHIAKVNNPHAVTKAQVGLGNVDNTADVNKNVLSATKLATARTINGVNFDGTANIVAPTNLAIGTRTATAVPIESSTGTNASIPAATTALAGVMSSADKVKLDGIAAGAQVNVATNLGITAGTTAGPIVTSSTGTNATLPTATASASGVVTTGNQDWAGVKTFNSSPIVPTPTTGTQAVNMNYADTKVAKVVSTDNAIVRFDGTTGELQNSGVTIDDNGNGNFGQVIQTTSASGFSGVQIISNNTSFGYINFGDIDDTNIGQISYQHSTDSMEFTTNNLVKARLDATGNLLLTSGTGALGYGAGAGGSVTQLTSKSTAVTLNKPSGRIITASDSLASGDSVYFMLNNSLLSVGDNLVVSNSSYGAYRIECRVVIGGAAFIYITNTSATQSQALNIYFSIIKGSAN